MGDFGHKTGRCICLEHRDVEDIARGREIEAGSVADGTSKKSDGALALLCLCQAELRGLGRSSGTAGNQTEEENKTEQKEEKLSHISDLRTHCFFVMLGTEVEDPGDVLVIEGIDDVLAVLSPTDKPGDPEELEMLAGN